MTSKLYPDNSAIHARKAQGRKERGAISFADKLDALDAMKKRLSPIMASREARKRRSAVSPAKT